jgi:hypothetical protein
MLSMLVSERVKPPCRTKIGKRGALSWMFFRPSGARRRFTQIIHGLRRGLYSFAAPRLTPCMNEWAELVGGDGEVDRDSRLGFDRLSALHVWFEVPLFHSFARRCGQNLGSTQDL